MGNNDPPAATSTRSSRLFILIICILFRWLNAYLTRTYDNPDEYWQAPEVAHYLVFGYGYMTWEWTHRIRSYLHPLIFACLYKCLAWCNLDSASLLVSAPRYLQATISAFGDMATYSLAKKVYGNDIAPLMLFVTLGSWFNFLMAPRTLSNTMETVLTVMAMKHWPFPGTTTQHWQREYRTSLLWASLACIIRPTNALIWAFLGLQLLYHARQRTTILLYAVTIVFVVLVLNMLIDTYFYGTWVFVPWRFLQINVFQSIALFYGAHPWHWYLSQGLPLMLLTYLPLTVFGATASGALMPVVLWVVGVYSLLSHKEFRFIYPIFPLLLLFTAKGLSMVHRWRGLVIVLLGVTQGVLALYVSLWHQRGVMELMPWIRHQPQTAGFVMPCHSTPWYSAVHTHKSMWFLTCDPHGVDQADVFYADPLAYLSTVSPAQLVLFDALLARPGVSDLLRDKGYVECKRFFNSHVHWDSRRKGDVVVFCQSV